MRAEKLKEKPQKTRPKKAAGEQAGSESTLASCGKRAYCHCWQLKISQPYLYLYLLISFEAKRYDPRRRQVRGLGASLF
jgi:hypothetical protein